MSNISELDITRKTIIETCRVFTMSIIDGQIEIIRELNAERMLKESLIKSLKQIKKDVNKVYERYR